MSMENCFEAGKAVRLINSPGDIGSLTGRTRELAGTIHWEVRFPEQKSFQPEYELEIVRDEDDDFEDLVFDGRYGNVKDLRRNLLHIQLSGRLANLVYSMDTTNTEFYAYQFKPLLSFLDSPSNGLLIADEVGLGKTIEAGLIWTELRSRYDARRLVVVCPAMLREKWRDELRLRFGVDGLIVDAKDFVEELKQPKYEIPDGRGLICSLQGIRPPRNWEADDSPSNPRAQLARMLDELSTQEPIIDLLVIDEAHYLRNPESQTSKLGKMLRDVAEHIVLLSATPVNLKDDDLYHLLNLVDPDTFQVKDFFPQILSANEPLIEARELALDKRSKLDDIRACLSDAHSHDALKSNLQLGRLLDGDLEKYDLSDNAERVNLANRIERINILRHVISRTRKVEVTEWKVVRDPFTEKIEMSEVENELYLKVTEAIRGYARSANVGAGFLLASPQRQVSSCMVAALESWNNKVGLPEDFFYEDLGEDLDPGNDAGSELSPLIEHLSREVLPYFNVDQLRQHDSKFDRFGTIVRDYLDQHPKEKIVVFSYFRYTLSYLSNRLETLGIQSQILVGGMDRPKQDVINDFRSDDSIRVLLSSEVASEGVDLQFCRVLINYDLPWNPMKIEQRIGRLDRIGQTSEKISVWNMCYAETIDERILEKLFNRLDIFKRALGGMEAILGEEIEQLTSDLIKSNLNKKQENERIEKTALAVEQIRLDEAEVEKNAAHLIAHGGYILEQVQAAHDFKKRITEHDLMIYVKDYLKNFCQGHTFHQLSEDKLEFDIQLPAQTATELDSFVRRKSLFGQTNLASGIQVRAEFLNKVPRYRHKVEAISQFHPLVRFISEDLNNRQNKFYPLVALSLSRDSKDSLVKDYPPGIYAFAIAKWTFEGLRTEEELHAFVASLDCSGKSGPGIQDEQLFSADESWQFVSDARSRGQDWYDASNQIDGRTLVDSIANSIHVLRERFERAREEKDLDNRDRVAFQVQSAERHRDRQLETHNAVLEKLKTQGNTRLIPAREGLINKVKERFEVQVNSLQTKGKLGSASSDVCYGVVKIV